MVTNIPLASKLGKMSNQGPEHLKKEKIQQGYPSFRENIVIIGYVSMILGYPLKASFSS